jgi:hypothetical protein
VWYNAAWTDETAYNTAVATAAAAALVAEGGTLNGNATVDGTTVTLNQSEVTIASGTTLNIPANVTLVVPNGKTFSMAGTFNITGAVTVESGGKYGFLNTGRGTSTGTITIENGGEVLSVPGSDMGGTGWTVIEAGGKAYAGASWEVKALFVGPSNGDAAIIKLASGSVATNNSGYKLDGVATVYGRSDAATNAQGTFWVGVVGSGATSAEKNKVLTIKAGGVLTVPGDDASTNKHILGVVTGEGDAEPGVVGEPANADNSKAAAQIVLQSHGYIDVYGPAPSSSSDYTQTIGNLNHNFYGTDGSTKVTENGLHDTTYNWVAAINSGAGGWQEAAE